MANAEHLCILKLGVDAWNKWREDHPDARPDLVRADLRGVRLFMANLVEADLAQADLGGADLTLADLRRADLSWADFTLADFHWADLRGAHFIGANLCKANLDKAVLGWTAFGGVDLGTCLGLDTVEHKGPSSIGIDTICRSGGRIPEAFLRGAGVPDEFIAYIGSLVGRYSAPTVV